MQNKMNSFIFYAEVQPIFAFLSKDSANRTNLLKIADFCIHQRRKEEMGEPPERYLEIRIERVNLH